MDQPAIATLRRVFGCDDIRVTEDSVVVAQHEYPLIDGVIVLLTPARLPLRLRQQLPLRFIESATAAPDTSSPFAEDIQSSFGAEWTTFAKILPEHQDEFNAYFDHVDLGSLSDALVADLGCGMGRWSYLLAPHVQNLVLVDFSEAIFVAQKVVSKAKPEAVFFLGDVTDLPFAAGAFDFAFSLGVLHHLPIDALEAIRRLAPLAPSWLFYLYYALDNRPTYYRWIFHGVDAVRRCTSRIRSERLRSVIATAGAVSVYKPLVGLGHVAAVFGKRHAVPLAEAYRGKTVGRIRQDVYDRFFTSIENRYSRHDIRQLKDTFDEVEIADTLPYWHFSCRAPTRAQRRLSISP